MLGGGAVWFVHEPGKDDAGPGFHDAADRNALARQEQTEVSEKESVDLRARYDVIRWQKDPNSDEVAGDAPSLEKRLANLEAKIDAAFDAGDGWAVLNAIRELIALGEEGYELAIPWILEVERDRKHGGKTLGLSHYEIAKAVDDLELYRYALTASDVDESFRFYAGLRLPWVGDPAVLDVILEVLPTEKNVAVVNFLADALRNLPGREGQIVEGLLDAVERVPEPRVRRRIFDHLRAQEGVRDDDRLRELLHSDDPELVREARVTLTFWSPPVEGFVVTRVRPGTPGAESGLMPGDIIVRCAGRPFSSGAELRELLAEAGEKTLQMERDGERRGLKIQGAADSGIEGAYRVP